VTAKRDPREVTEEWIAQHAVVDDRGTPHRPHGIWTCEARLYVWVCFDGHQQIGRRAWYFFTRDLQVAAWKLSKTDIKPIPGGRDGVKIKQTGMGYLISPLRERIDRVEPIPELARFDSAMAVEIVCDQLRSRQFEPRLSTPEEQIRSIDIVANDLRGECGRYGENPLTLEVKSRGPGRENQSLLYLQISETNPDKLIR